MTSQRPKGFQPRESKESEKPNDETNPNVEKFRRQLLSKPQEGQKTTNDDQYKELSADERNKRVINDFLNAAKTWKIKAEEMKLPNATFGEILEHTNKREAYQAPSTFKELFERDVVHQEITVGMMQSEQSSDKYQIYDTQTGAYYEYHHRGNGHSLMKYAYTNQSNEIYFSDVENDPQYPMGTGQDKFAIVYRHDDNIAKGYALELPNRSLDTLSDRDRAVLQHVLERINDDNLEKERLAMQNSVNNDKANRNTKIGYRHALSAINEITRFYEEKKYRPGSDKEVNAAADALQYYYEVKEKYNNNTYTQTVRTRLDTRINILRDEDKNTEFQHQDQMGNLMTEFQLDKPQQNQ